VRAVAIQSRVWAVGLFMRALLSRACARGASAGYYRTGVGTRRQGLRSFVALAVVAGLSACADAPGPPAGTDCVTLFQRYDLIDATMSTPNGRRDRQTIPPDLQWITSVIRQNGCISLTRELDFGAAAAPVTESGPTLPRPVRVHAGAVTSMADDAAAQAFFRGHGVAVASIGSPSLGRRIYIGPFATQGALEAGLALARAAGFTYAYPARF